MCIICVSKSGEQQPADTTLRAMFRRNPHGAGYMYARDGKVTIHKGFMNIEDFLSAVHAERFTPQDSVVYHFRISTQAGVNAAMTHPFPLSNQPRMMRALDLTCRCGIAHNGVMVSAPQRGHSICSPACCRAFKSSSRRSMRSVILLPPFDYGAGIHTVQNAQRRTAVPVHKDVSGIVHTHHRTHGTGFQIRPVRVVHLEKPDAAARRVVCPEMLKCLRRWPFHRRSPPPVLHQPVPDVLPGAACESPPSVPDGAVPFRRWGRRCSLSGS